MTNKNNNDHRSAGKNQPKHMDPIKKVQAEVAKSGSANAEYHLPANPAVGPHGSTVVPASVFPNIIAPHKAK